MNNNIKDKKSIMVIDDHPIIHDGLKTLLASEPDIEITISAMSSHEAHEKIAHQQPDIVIADLSLGDSDGTHMIQNLISTYPALKILVYTMSEEKLYAERTAMAGASGYVMKTRPPTELRKAIRTVLRGELFFSSDLQRKVRQANIGLSEKPTSIIDLLSNREMDVFNLLGQGMDASAIASKLNISRNTVDTHRINIKNKLSLPSGKALERLAYEVIVLGKIEE
ncbi:MAG: response regulator transcription factor [Pontiella sp.]|nr:response regulator transcription factor [Pontiella sp.]MBT8046326.1 response regulator transcription factor [Pontiella sp.]NNJ70252.1 response regulator transcription factor [Kiritimatiellales bacterium]